MDRPRNFLFNVVLAVIPFFLALTASAQESSSTATFTVVDSRQTSLDENPPAAPKAKVQPNQAHGVFVIENHQHAPLRRGTGALYIDRQNAGQPLWRYVMPQSGFQQKQQQTQSANREAVRSLVKRLYQQLAQKDPSEKELEQAIQAYEQWQQKHAQQKIQQPGPEGRVLELALPSTADPTQGRLPAVLTNIPGLDPEYHRFFAANLSSSLCGMQVGELSPSFRGQFAVPDDRGLQIIQVEDDSPAARLGFQQHDVLLSISGQPIKTPVQLTQALLKLGVGEQEAEVIRVGQRKTLKLTRTKAFPELQTKSWWIGVHIDEIDDVTRHHLQLNDGRGVMVLRVLPKSPAERAGIKAFDVLLSADKLPLKELDDVRKAVQRAADKSLQLEVLRQRQRQKISVQPEQRETPVQEGLQWKPQEQPNQANEPSTGQAAATRTHLGASEDYTLPTELGYPLRRVILRQPVLLESLEKHDLPSVAGRVVTSESNAEIKELKRQIEVLAKSLQQLKQQIQAAKSGQSQR